MGISHETELVEREKLLESYLEGWVVEPETFVEQGIQLEANTGDIELREIL